MSVLVTGGSGLVGHQAASLLLDRGQNVICYDRRPPEGERLAQARYVVGDLSDHPRLFGTIKRFGVRDIVHAGAASGPMVEPDNPFSVCQANILGTLNVYEAARLFDVRRVVYCSSDTVYGSVRADAVHEDTAFRPRTVYGVTKATGDQLGAVYSTQYDLDVVALRFSWIYGPGRSTSCSLRDMIRDALLGRPTRLAEGADQYYQYLYVKDAAAAIVAALSVTKLQQHAYNVTGGQRHSLAQVAAIVRRALPNASIELGPGVVSLADQQPLFDISGAERDLGYAPQYSLEHGISEYTAWLRQHAR